MSLFTHFTILSQNMIYVKKFFYSTNDWLFITAKVDLLVLKTNEHNLTWNPFHDLKGAQGWGERELIKLTI